MSFRSNHVDLDAAEADALQAIDAPDGRVVRRERNTAAVLAAVLELLRVGEQPTLAAIAEQAGVATRSVYRYFGDADTAVREAIAERHARVVEVFESEPRISATSAQSERLGMLVLRRLRLDRLVEPLDGAVGLDDLFDSLDLEVREAFAPELVDGDRELGLLLCGLFRLRTVRSMRDVFDEVDQEIASAMMRAGSALLAPRNVH